MRAQSSFERLQRLVSEVESRWRAAHFERDRFPEIAAGALEKCAPYRHFDPLEVLSALGEGSSSFRIEGDHDSSLVIPLIQSGRFDVLLNIWADNVGEPHSHAWGGAFQVLHGACVHGLFAFDEQWAVDPKFRLGRLELRRLEVLRPGAVMPVFGGPRLIHGQSYADRPGYALSIRTVDYGDLLTCNYWHPGLAVQTNFVDKATRRQLKALDALSVVDPPACFDAYCRALRAADVRTTFLLLEHAHRVLRGRIDVSSLDAVASKTLGRGRKTLLGALDSVDRRQFVERRRELLTDWRDRFLSGALFLAPDRAALMNLVRREYPRRDPVRFVAERLVAMASTGAGGDRSLLGTPLDPLVSRVVGLMVENGDPGWILDALKRREGLHSVRGREAELRDTIAAVRDWPLLHPLFIV